MPGTLRRITKLLHALFALQFLFAIGCGESEENNNNDGAQIQPGPGPVGPGGPGPQGSTGQLAIGVTADIQGAYGLLVMDDTSGGSGAALALVDRHNKTIEDLGLKGAKKIEVISEKAQTNLTAISGEFSIAGEVFSFPKKGLNLTNEEEDDSKLKKIDETSGEIKDALSEEDRRPEDQKHGPTQKLPNLLTIAVSPTKDVYLHFEHSFQYRDVPDGTEADPWDRRSGYQCQIFKIQGGTLDELLVNAPTPDNLECLHNQHFIDNWRTTANSVFQFDSAGNVYYPGSNPENGKMAVYKRLRDGSATTEVINANICIQDFLITDAGGIFYTGQTCQNNNQGGGDGGFFRYVAPGENGSVIEIARNWWNFIYDTNSANDATTDSAVFFGPDPRSATTASWNSACLFNFDPTQDNPSSRISDVITCGSDIWRWMELSRTVDVETYGEGYHNNTSSDHNFTPSDAWKKEYARRCTSQGQIFAGGGSQIKSIKQTSTGEIFVIGNIRKKNKGKLLCEIEVQGPHCVVDGVPMLSYVSNGDTIDINTQAICSTQSGTWKDEGSCSNGDSTSDNCLNHDRVWNSETSVCSSETDANASDYNNREHDCTPIWNTNSISYRNVESSLCIATETGDRENWWEWNSKVNRYGATDTDDHQAKTALSAKFLVRHFNCAHLDNETEWTTELQALAQVEKTSKNLTMLSSDREQAIDVWLVDDKPYYSSFDTQDGKYLLSGLVTADTCFDQNITSSDDCSGDTRTWTERRCVDSSYTAQTACEDASLTWSTIHSAEVKSNFETYNLAPSGVASELFIDGLDFNTNQYKFGSLNTETKEISLKQGLTGTLKTIVILPD